MNFILLPVLACFIAVQAVGNYKFLSINDCTASPDGPIAVSLCVAEGSTANVSVTFKGSVNKIGVRIYQSGRFLTS
jgi:hypothetical protein